MRMKKIAMIGLLCTLQIWGQGLSDIVTEVDASID